VCVSALKLFFFFVCYWDIPPLSVHMYVTISCMYVLRVQLPSLVSLLTCELLPQSSTLTLVSNDS
jgi:hypothetical protein